MIQQIDLRSRGKSYPVGGSCIHFISFEVHNGKIAKLDFVQIRADFVLHIS